MAYKCVSQMWQGPHFSEDHNFKLSFQKCPLPQQLQFSTEILLTVPKWWLDCKKLSQSDQKQQKCQQTQANTVSDKHVHLMLSAADEWQIYLDLNRGYMGNINIIILKLFQPPKEFWNHFKIISATLNMLENIRELQSASDIILKYFQASFHALK